ncbi:MAG: B12-binding domain-containing protein [Roseovarius sp.]
MEFDDATETQTDPKGPAIRFLVESALRIVSMEKSTTQPQTRQDWVEHLTAALVSETDAPHQAIVTSMMSRGISSEEILQSYVPAAAYMLGELWVSDKASFVDVTVGGARLQQLFRSSSDHVRGGWPGRVVPLGQSMLMMIPNFEDHSLGAFVAADHLRRHGIWMHMGIGLEPEELVATIDSSCYSALGISLATAETADKSGELIQYLRTHVEHLPPVVVGGRAVAEVEGLQGMIGADHAANSAPEVIEKCGFAALTPAAIADDTRRSS